MRRNADNDVDCGTEPNSNSREHHTTGSLCEVG